MSKTFTITLSDALDQVLARTAAQVNRSTEEVIVQLLTQTFLCPEEATSASDPSSDPLLQLAGCITVDVTDLAENHDHYIGQALNNELPQKQ